MATLLELAKIKHHAVRSDGAKFIDGERDDNLDTSWLEVEDGLVTLGKGLYDELLVVKGEVSDDQIKTWAAMQSPFYDPASNIVFEGAGGRIEMDKHGQRFIRSADQKTMIELDTETGNVSLAGHIEADGGYFRGRVEAEEGYFRGDITGATGEFSGSLKAKSITASMYAEIRNTMPYVGLSSLDSSKPIVIPIYIPSETVNIAGAFLSAEARRYRAYAKSAPQRTDPWITSTASVQDTVHSPRINLKTDWDDTIYLENANTHYHSFDFTHEHDLVFGIHEDTTPSNVRLRIDNGAGWSNYINLASAPNTTSPYDLISNANVPKYNNNSSEMNLGSYLSGTGWKYLEFSSARLGMIAWNIILKLDITA